MSDKYILLDVDDPRAESIAEAISNKTSKRILALLVEREMSASDMAERLGLPLNTIGYNIEKLVEAGLIDKSPKFFWSSKGKRINTYTLSNKKILISPRKSFRGILVALVSTAIISLGIRIFSGTSQSLRMTPGSLKVADSALYAAESAPTSEAAGSSSGLLGLFTNAPNSWAWFFLGALTALLIYLVWSWSKRGKI